MVERLTRETVESRETRRHGARVGEDLARLPESPRVDLGNRFAGAPVFLGGGEVAVRGSELVVGLAVLVDEPDDLVGMRRGVAGEARRDDGIDSLAADLFQVEAAPGERAADEIETLVLDQRHRHAIRLDAALLQLLREPPHVPLGAAFCKRRLDGQDEDAGRCAHRVIW